jgi:hypothetical protein
MCGTTLGGQRNAPISMLSRDGTKRMSFRSTMVFLLRPIFNAAPLRFVRVGCFLFGFEI